MKRYRDIDIYRYLITGYRTLEELYYDNNNIIIIILLLFTLYVYTMATYIYCFIV